MKNHRKLLAFLLAAVICTGLFAGCGKDPSEVAPLTVACNIFDGKFSPFFSELESDQAVQTMTQISLLTFDRDGSVIEKGIDGTTSEYDGTSYTYYGPADLEIAYNPDGSVDYNFTLRDDITFSDGEKLTIDDVIFSMYVLSDPSYDGVSEFCELPIKGMSEYRGNWGVLNELIFNAGRENTDFGVWSAEQQNTFWTEYDAASTALAGAIADACVSEGFTDEGDIIGAADGWGFTIAENTIESFASALSDAYGADVYAMVSTESPGPGIDKLFPGYDDFTAYVPTGGSADSISGIVKTGEYSMSVKATHFDASLVYKLAISIAPLHYYGDPDAYSYDECKFGFTKGDLTAVKDKNAVPLGAGPYKLLNFENGIVSFEANDNYYLGEPKTRFVNFREYTNDSDIISGILNGALDISAIEYNNDTAKAIKDANKGALSGSEILTASFDSLGYGYIGMNADKMCINNEPASEASENLRKAFATLFSVYRAAAADAYYGDAAAVIEYPVAGASWAMPKQSDDGYRTAFSVNVDGSDIYTADMTSEERYAAAKFAALGYFEAAGYTVADGVITSAPAGGKLEFTAWIPGGGIGDHPSAALFTEASAALKDIGITLTLNDVSNTEDVWNAVCTDGLEIWASAWSATYDPDIYPLYYSGNDTGRAPGKLNFVYGINDSELNELIVDARSSADKEYRRKQYLACFDIINDWAVNLPFYRHRDAVIFNAERISEAPALTAFCGWLQVLPDI